METLTGLMIAGFIIFSGKLISSGELGLNNFFSFLAAMMLVYQPIRSLATKNMVAYQGAAAFKRVAVLLIKCHQLKKYKVLQNLFLKSRILNLKMLNSLTRILKKKL